MKKFLYLYTGGRMPDTDDGVQKMMGLWHTYFEALGSTGTLVDGGAPFGPRDSVAGAPTSTITGYSIVQAEDLAKAVALTDGHPHIAYDGGIEVVEAMDMPA